MTSNAFDRRTNRGNNSITELSLKSTDIKVTQSTKVKIRDKTKL